MTGLGPSSPTASSPEREPPPVPPGPLLEVEDLSLRFPRAAGGEQKVLDGLRFSVEPDQTLALVGPSGSGKSLTASAILGLVPSGAVASGRMAFDGVHLDLAPTSRRETRDLARRFGELRGGRIALVPQSPVEALEGTRRVGRQMSRLAGVDGSRALSLLERVGLQDPVRTHASFPHELSGGELQRVMVALAIARRPQLLLADEPTTALDAPLRRELLELLHELRERHRMAMLLISHDLALVAEVADRVVIVQDGRIIEEGGPSQVLGNPRQALTRELVAARHRTIRPGSRPAVGPAETKLPPLLEVEALGVTHHRPGILRRRAPLVAVENLSFVLKTGRTLGLVGPSGSGKSTVARALTRLGPISSGTVLFHGVDVSTLRGAEVISLRRRCQMIQQSPRASLDPRQTVAAVLDEPSELLLGLRDRSLLRQRRRRLLEEVGLSTDLEERRPYQLSGGECQRVAIARALASGPEVLVCDEITSSLDTLLQARILDLLAELRRSRGLALVFISHDRPLVEALADSVVELEAPRPER